MIEMGRVYRTEDRCEVRIYALDAGGQTPVHGAIKRNGLWIVTSWTKEGRWSISNPENNLIEVKSRIQREVWVNVYSGRIIGNNVFEERITADSAAKFAGQNRIACVKLVIDCEEGEGL
jgi:hypothetical protein